MDRGRWMVEKGGRGDWLGGSGIGSGEGLGAVLRAGTGLGLGRRVGTRVEGFGWWGWDGWGKGGIVSLSIGRIKERKVES